MKEVRLLSEALSIIHAAFIANCELYEPDGLTSGRWGFTDDQLAAVERAIESDQ